MITKFKSRNLYGETREQEKKRLLNARVQAILQGKSRNVSYDSGTSQSQKRARRNILIKSNLPTKNPKYLDLYE